LDNVDVFSRVTVVGSRRRLDVTLPSTVPVADLIWDLVEMLAESDGGLPASWALIRVGGQALDPERPLSEQGVVQGTMLFLRDATRQDPPPAIDDYAVELAIAVDAQGGRWTAAAAPPMLAWAAAACSAAAGVALLLAGDPGSQALIGVAGALIAAAAGWVISQRFLRRSTGGLIAMSAIPLWAAAGAGLAGLAGASSTSILAASLGSSGIGAAIAIVVAGEIVLLPAAGIITITLLPALVLGVCALVGAGPVPAAALLCPIALGSLALPGRLAVRLAGVDRGQTAAVSARARRGRRLHGSMLVGIALVLIASSAILAASGGWFAWGLVGATAIGAVAKARHFRFTAEVAPLLAAGLVGLVLLEYPLIGALAIGPKGIGGAAALLVVDALVLALTGIAVRRWDLSPQLRRQLGRLELIATAATLPLAVGVLGAYSAVARLVHGFS
jgi:type VII secretion integral membrane protein EccD